MSNPAGLTDKVVLITGAGSGIGLATAKAFAEEGAFVVAADLAPEAARSLPGRHPPETTELDVREPGSLETWIASTAAAHGRVDVLVNNVGIAAYRGGLLSVELATWRDMMEVNLLSAVRACRSAIPHMVGAGGGVIVSLASDVARQPTPGFVDYAATKAALVSLSKSISLEFAAAGIRANCVAPGPTLTPPVEAALRHIAQERKISPEEALAQFVSDHRIPLQRLSEPGDVAAVILFLASDAARHVTGSVYPVDGGIIVAV
jgi:NAD(P)-dependent dehydrogenase (short-subunit alcohol dehydrogenase family)